MPKAGAIDKIEWAFQKPIRFCLLLDVIIKPTACCKLLNVLFMADDSTLCCVDHRRSRLSCIVQGGSRQISAFYVVNSSRKSITHTAPAHESTIHLCESVDRMTLLLLLQPMDMTSQGLCPGLPGSNVIWRSARRCHALADGGGGAKRMDR